MLKLAKLLRKINASDAPAVTCIVSDGAMSFTLDAARELGVSESVPQQQVLAHPAIVGFLTQSAWNSTLESVSERVPMIPFVTILVKELMDGEKGKQMKDKALPWKELAQSASSPHRSSLVNLDNMVREVLLIQNVRK
ncbi:hypothetical protein Fmac_031569 [Flemingia macrophylla]|uniref:Uncharacterized protein n=1 Tax=Flemingia macrophylla TaxID=520843 RepID=A0ABD1L2X6_9FABA